MLLGNSETRQEDNAIFYQTMCVVHNKIWKIPTENMAITDLADVMLYPDFSGIFDRNTDNPKTACTPI